MTTLFSNNAIARLDAPVYAGATAFTVESGHGALFPTPTPGDQFYVRLGTDLANEVVRVTARTEDAFTCDPIAQPWATYTTVVLTVSAELLAGAFQDTLTACTEATAADRVQTGLDAAATAADRVQTGLDAAATAADRVQTGLDVIAADEAQHYAEETAADRVQTGLDAEATAADRVQTGLDVIAAEQAKDDAETAQTAAELAQSLAEQARDAATVGGNIFADTTAGIAGTSSGDYFSVPSTAAEGYLDLYLNNSGAPVFIKQYPSVDGVLEKRPNEFINGMNISDSNGNITIGIGGEVSIGDQVTLETGVNIETSRMIRNPFIGFGVCDSNGYLGFWVDKVGVSYPSPESYAANFGEGFTADVNHLFLYGQSLSVGVSATPALSTSQSYDNLMFYRGMIPQIDYPLETVGEWYASLSPAVEGSRETPCSGAGNIIKQLILNEDGLAYTDMQYQMMLSAPGQSAMHIGSLGPGSIYYTRLTTQATYGLALANADSKTYAARAVCWMQGESDYTNNNPRHLYSAALQALANNLSNSLKAITGQSTDVALISYQIASHKAYSHTTPTIALAQLDASEASDKVFIACPMYIFSYGDNVHLTNTSSRWCGAYFGLAYKRIIIDGEAWKPLKPLSATRHNTVVRLEFHVPSGSLTFDTTLVSANTNYGFELVDSGGNPITISSVTITGPKSISIVAATAIEAGSAVRYAWSGAGLSGPTTGARGNLRDTQGDTIVFDPTGANKPMHNWCVIFEMVV